MILIDANLLVYAVDADSPHHTAARRFIEEALSGDESVGLAWIVILAFLRITTRAGILRRQLSPEAALAYVDQWLAQDCVNTVIPGPQHWALLRTLLNAAGTAGNLTSDAHLAALAIEQGATLCSTDGDFARFPGIRYANPLS